MRHNARISMWTAMLCIPSAVLCHAQPVSSNSSTGAPTNVTPQLEEICKEHSIPALAALVRKDGAIVAQGAAGVRAMGHSEPLTIDDQFHIGSCTKSMTATLCAMLVERGKLRWDTTIREAFPDLAPQIREEYLPVTLEQLLNHRGGLPEDRTPGPVFAQVAQLTGDIRAQRLSMTRIVLSQPPAARPGDKMMYSNFGYAIAGTMAEQAMNKPWEDLIREMLFEPLGMKSAGFGPPGVENEKNPSEPWGHQPGVVSLAPRSPGPGSDNPACMGPCGLVHLSLPDWSRYGLFHMGELNPPTPLLKPETLAKLHTDEFKQDYGFGWAIARPAWAKGPLFSHAGSNGLWFAVIHLAPERHFELLVATNAASEGAQKACSEAAKMLREQFVPDEK